MIIKNCRACSSGDLSEVLSLGWLPLANHYLPIGSSESVKYYPHDLLRCNACGLAQLSLALPPDEVFGNSYPYTSSTTKALRDNFAGLRREVATIRDLASEDLVIDIGGNDGNLLSNFEGCRRLNVTPEDMGRLGAERGIEHLQAYWSKEIAALVASDRGAAKVITATNVFAHIASPGEFIEGVLSALDDDGLFVVECQSFCDLVAGCQYDHLYQEHQMFWAPRVLARFLAGYGLGVLSYSKIPTHGGSFRFICWRGKGIALDEPEPDITGFGLRVANSKTDLWSLLAAQYGKTIAGLCAPSRASTLVSYVGLDHNILTHVAEVAGSHKLWHYMPGTKIPIVEETSAQYPDIYLVLAHHIADELMASLRAKGFQGRFIVPLPEPRIVG